VQIGNLRIRAAPIGAIVVGVIVVIAVGVRWRARPPTPDEVHSVVQTNERVGAVPSPPARLPESTSAGSNGTIAYDSVGSAQTYPVNLDKLRGRLPDNRYWTLGAPTSDPVVAKARAARAERDNVVFGRIQSNEAAPAEIRAYYAERRAISRDYLQLAELVLAEQGEALPPRDRGMFELSANLHRARLQQIERDEADALARRGER
jgi:hypothetical protein